MIKYIMGIIVILHFLLAWRTQRKINRSLMFTPFQKRMNSVLNWLVPFFWSFLVKNLIQLPENPVKMKANRRGRKTKGNTSGFELVDDADVMGPSLGGDHGF